MKLTTKVFCLKAAMTIDIISSAELENLKTQTDHNQHKPIHLRRKDDLNAIRYCR
jgi:hypothetical protein